MVERTEVTPLQAKVWLLLVHSYSFPTLSRNILREVCMYVGGQDLLPCLFNNTLHLYDLDTRQDTVVTLSRNFDASWVYCNIDDKCLLGVYGSTALTISLCTFAISPAGALNINRKWPGMGWASPNAYIFGGGFSPAPTSCEKLQWETGVWRAIGDMKGPKSCFTPCRVRNEFYLCCYENSDKPFEAFNLTTETFRDLPVTYSSSLYGSVTCLVEDSLYIVAYDEILLQWKLDQLQLEEIYKRINLKGKYQLGCSNIPPMCVGRKVYWVCYSNGYLVSLDVDTALIEINTWENSQ